MFDYQSIKGAVVGREKEIKSIIAAMSAGKHILLEGPPGTSKTTILKRITQTANLPLYVLEGNIDLSPAKLVGHFNPAKVIADNYHPDYFEKGPLTRAMEEGGVLYIEEFNRMPADATNVLITPMEDRILHIPRYGMVKAKDSFIVIAAQNPYDDVGTVRVSRAFMDRISRIKVDYQSEAEEVEIVQKQTGCPDKIFVEKVVQVVRLTRSHNDIKMGASVRAAMDIISICMFMQQIEDLTENEIITALLMSLTGKIWLNELSNKTPEEVIMEIYNQFKNRYGAIRFNDDGARDNVSIIEPTSEDISELEAKKNCGSRNL